MPLDIVLPSLRAFRRNWNSPVLGYMPVCTATLLLATTILLQLTSTILVSDLSLGMIPGKPSQATQNFDFSYTNNGGSWEYRNQPRAVSTWSRNPSAFPTFAEFSEAPDASHYVDDTGTLFRAFLPFQDAQSRTNVMEYSGRALVLDARVSCQRPHLSDFDMFPAAADNRLTGYFSSTKTVPGLLGGADQVPFNCSFNTISLQDAPFLSICQVSGRYKTCGKLASELRDAKEANAEYAAEELSGSGDSSAVAAYLVVNSSLSNTSLATSDLGAWNDLSFPLETSPGRHRFHNLRVSLCYPALWTARLNVTFRSSTTRREPAATLSNTTYFATIPDVHAQMGEFKDNPKYLYVRRLSICMTRTRKN